MAKGFYGRAGAYEAGLAAAPGSLEEAVRRNIYGTAPPAAGQAERMAAYARAAAATLAAQPLAAFLEGRASFAATAW